MPYQLENTMPTLVTTDSDAEYMEYQLSTEFCKGEMVGDSDITRYAHACVYVPVCMCLHMHQFAYMAATVTWGDDDMT